ncbi:LysR family transcriptional regulator [Lampropedia cohaerens]|uniref:LysR family transcriptional regulator n=1 Tax=Lampropedia cohaerens TaxID=1610491 RepID=A0A0U1Q092_9BURK|nr:LysR family transcriptional regulator [Lampropedia cohaerens]KKW68178.1 LysR family transcriptional regulator [Lampropedia cohaerens]
MHESARLTRNLSLTTLQLFATVCETGSIAQAAERAFIAASAVSKRLSDLESELGLTLLERHSRGVRPTPAGENLLQHTRSILADIDRLHADLQEYAEGVRGHVRVLANLSAIVQFLPEDLSRFAAENPAIKLDLQERMSSQTLAAVQEGSVELGICYTPGAMPAMVEARPYRQDHLVLVLPRGHALLQAASSPAPALDFAQALDYEFVGLHSASSIGLLMRQAAAAAGRSLRQRIEVSGLDTMCRMIDNGLGIGVMPDRAFALMQGLGRLTALPLADAWARRQSWIIARDFDALPTASRLLASHLAAQAAQPLPPLIPRHSPVQIE